MTQHDPNLTFAASREDYQLCFSGPHGIKVLAHILSELGFFTTKNPEDIEAMSRRNYATHLLANCGILDEQSGMVTDTVVIKRRYEQVQQLLSLTQPETTKKQE
jgi:hypothetical protein